MRAFVKIKQKDGWIKRNLVHSCQFKRNGGYPYVDIRLDDEMLPYLIGMTGCFSTPRLDNLRFFKKDHHFKLHAFFYSYLYRGSTGEISLEQLRELLDIKKSHYQLVGHLKSRLLDPTIRLINEVTDIHVLTSNVKHGRRIV